MACKTCGCIIETCGCCEGTTVVTPMSILNRPGLDALDYRVGTQGTFLESMKARLAAVEVVAPGADGQTLEAFRPLEGLTTRNPNDPAIALLDGWAAVGDVLTFYQERIANEGYIRTATERFSVVELARMIGFELRPGIAASAFLAWTLNDSPDEFPMPAGTPVKTVPGPGETPQTFETAETLRARSEWNQLQL